MAGEDLPQRGLPTLRLVMPPHAPSRFCRRTPPTTMLKSISAAARVEPKPSIPSAQAVMVKTAVPSGCRPRIPG